MRDVGSLTKSISDIRLARSVLSLRVPEMALGLAKMSLGWLCRVFEEKCALQRTLEVPKSEVGELTERKNEDEEAIVYGGL